MLSVQDPEILSLVPDYRINLFSPAEIKDEELDKLESNLKEVMLFIKYSKDKRKLQELTSQSPGFRSLELKAARVIDSITGIHLRFTETERISKVLYTPWIWNSIRRIFYNSILYYDSWNFNYVY